MKKNAIRANRSVAAVFIASVLAVLGMLTTPAVGYASTEAYPVTPFRLEYGASVLAGSITWYDRSIHITGSVKAVSTGKTGKFQGESSRCLSAVDTRTASVGETRHFVVDIPCDFPGGITLAYVGLWDVQGNYLRGAICTRSSCVIKD